MMNIRCLFVMGMLGCFLLSTWSDAKPASKLSGSIDGLQFIEVLGTQQDWNKDKKNDGVEWALRYYDKDKRKIQFSGVIARVDIRVFAFTPKKTRGRLVYQASNLPITSNIDYSTFPKDRNAKNAIHFKKMKTKAGKDPIMGIYEFTVTTASQGKFKAVKVIAMYQKEQGEGPKLPLNPAYASSRAGHVRGLDRVRLGAYGKSWEGDYKPEGIEIAVTMMDKNEQVLTFSGVPLVAHLTLYQRNSDKSRGSVLLRKTHRFKKHEDRKFQVAWKDIKQLAGAKKLKTILEVTLKTPKQGEYKAVDSRSFRIK